MLLFVGIPLTTEAGEKIGVSSTTAAVQGISMVTISRIAMASPGMLLLPVFMDKLEKRGVLARFVALNRYINQQFFRKQIYNLRFY